MREKCGAPVGHNRPFGSIFPAWQRISRAGFGSLARFFIMAQIRLMGLKDREVVWNGRAKNAEETLVADRVNRGWGPNLTVRTDRSSARRPLFLYENKRWRARNSAW